MVAWFKHDIPAWMDGTEALDDGPYRAYHVICQLIYLNEGPIALNEHGIAGRCKQSIRTFRASLKILLELGKLKLLDGRLANSRAEKELENVSENRVNAAKGGQKSAEARKSVDKSLKNNNTDQATLQDSRSLKTREEETTVEKTREEKKDPPLRADDWPKDFGDLFWKAYPRKTEKLATMKKLATLRKSGIVTFADLMAGANRYAAVKPDPKYTKQPTTWLNAGCWADETQPGTSNGNRTGNPKTSGHDAILAVANRKARELDRNDDLAGTADAAGFAIGDGVNGSGPRGNSDAARSGERDHHRIEPDDQRIREGEIIPPDKNAAGVPSVREFV